MTSIGLLILGAGVVGIIYGVLVVQPLLRNSAIGVALIGLLIASFAVVPAGQTGVVFNVFGGVQDDELGEGFHIVLPLLQQVTLLSARDQAIAFNSSENDDIPALSREGLQITTDATIRFRIDPAQANVIFQTLGTDYETTLIRPQVRSVIRDRIAQYNAAEVISTQRTELQQGIKDALDQELGKGNIILIDVLLRDIRIPNSISQAIEEKQRAEQQVQVEENRKRQSLIAAERRVIEAEGERDATIARAEGAAQDLELRGQAIQNNPGIIQLEVAQRLSPGVQTIMLPSEGNFLLDIKGMMNATPQSSTQSQSQPRQQQPQGQSGQNQPQTNQTN